MRAYDFCDNRRTDNRLLSDPCYWLRSGEDRRHQTRIHARPRPAHHEGSVACNDLLFHLRKLYSIRHFDNVALIGVSIVFHVVASLLMFVLARLLIPSQDKDRVFQFRFIFGNTGFMGIPLSCERVQGAGVSRPRRAP